MLVAMTFTNTARQLAYGSRAERPPSTQEKIVSYDEPWRDTAPEAPRYRDDEDFLLSRERGLSSEPVRDVGVLDTDATYPSTVGLRSDAERETRVIGFPRISRLPPARETFHALQEWEGVVTGIGDQEFLARLIDVTSDAAVDEEEATFPIAEVSEQDVERMREGSVFRWVIGYERSAMGQKKRISQIVFRDLPALTVADVERGNRWAISIRRTLDATWT